MENKHKYNLFLDDERKVSDVKWIELPLVDWTIVRSYKKFVQTIEKLGLPRIVTLDHDLSHEHYEQILNKNKINYSDFKEKTGYHAAKWLVEFCAQNNLKLPEYYVHSLNPIGRENILSLLISFKKFQEEGAN